MGERPSAYALWQQSCDEHGQGTDEQKRRYADLLREHGLVVPRKPGDPPTLPCRLDDLLSPAERADLSRDLTEMARLRRQAEADAANWPMP